MYRIIQQASQQTRHLDNLMRVILSNRDDAWAKNLDIRESVPASHPQPTKLFRTTDRQLSAIINLCKTKQRRIPANILQWSRNFASRYIRFLISLPFPRREQPRYLSETDMLFASQRRPLRGEYYWSDGMTLPMNASPQGGLDDGENVSR